MDCAKLHDFIFPEVPSSERNNIATFLEKKYGDMNVNVYWKNTRGFYQWINRKHDLTAFYRTIVIVLAAVPHREPCPTDFLSMYQSLESPMQAFFLQKRGELSSLS